jgi:predicted ATPase
MQPVLTALGMMGYQFFGAYHRLLLAEALICANQTNSALTALDDGLALSDAELHRRKGELLFGDDEGNHIQAEQELRLAVGIARGQEAKLFELRTATSLAHLLSRQGRRADACKMLAPI